MKNYWKWIVLILIVIGLIVASAILPVKDWIRSFINWVQQLGPLGVVVFIAAYALATVLFLPGWIFTVGAGLVYGVVGGTLVALTGAVIGATLAFIVARYFVRKNIEDYAKKNRASRRSMKRSARTAGKLSDCCDLSPLIPFNLSNYFYGITAVSLKAYVAISAVGMIPGTLLYAYLGAHRQSRDLRRENAAQFTRNTFCSALVWLRRSPSRYSLAESRKMRQEIRRGLARHAQLRSSRKPGALS